MRNFTHCPVCLKRWPSPWNAITENKMAAVTHGNRCWAKLQKLMNYTDVGNDSVQLVACWIEDLYSLFVESYE